MDPISITASVVTIIKVTGEVAFLLKQFCDDTSLVESTLSGLLNDVTGFQQVLESMHDTFSRDEVNSSFGATGHLGNHWKNLSRALKSGTETLVRLRTLLDSINVTRSFLDGPRKQFRLKTAVDQIALLRDQVQSYHGALQLSLSSIIFAGQATIQKSTDMIAAVIIPNQNRLYDEFRSFGARLYTKIEALESQQVHVAGQDAELVALHDLRDCVRSAADVVSAASTTMQSEAKGGTSVKYGSDFGDLFVKDSNEAMRRWMTTNTVHEFEDVNSPMPAPSEAGITQASTEYSSDSDSDIEKDMVRALYSRGKKCKETGDMSGAERQFRICLSRLHALSASTSRASLQRPTVAGVSKAELLELLTEVYSAQGAWSKAKVTMLERLAIVKRQVGSKSEAFLWDTIKLIELLMKNKDFAEAQLHGRQALQGFKKLRQAGYTGYERCLVLLVHICQEAGNLDDEDAFAAMLEVHLSKSSSFTATIALDLSEAADTSASSDRRLKAVVSERTSPHESVGTTLPVASPSAEQTPRDDSVSLHNVGLFGSAGDTGPQEESVLEEVPIADTATSDSGTARGSPNIQVLLTPTSDPEVSELAPLTGQQPPIFIEEALEVDPEQAADNQLATSQTSTARDSFLGTSEVQDTDVLESMMTESQQQASSTGAPSILSTDLSPSECAGSSNLPSIASQSSRPTTPTSFEQHLDLESPITILTSFCQRELGLTPVLMIGRGRAGFNAFVRINGEGTRQDIAKVVGYKTKEQAKDATASLAYQMLSSLTFDESKMAHGRTVEERDACLQSAVGTDDGTDDQSQKAILSEKTVRSSDVGVVASSPADPVAVVPTEPLSPVQFVLVNEQGAQIQTAIDTTRWGHSLQRNATTSRLYPSNQRTKQVSMTELADSRQDWLDVGSSSNVASPVHRRTASTSQLPTTTEEWAPGDDVEISVKATGFILGGASGDPVSVEYPPDSYSAEAALEPQELLRENSGLPSLQPEDAKSGTSSCFVCNFQFGDMSDEAVVQHVHACLYGSFESHESAAAVIARGPVVPTEKIQQSSEANIKQDTKADEPIKSCLVCDMQFEGFSQDAIAVHVDRCLDEAFARPARPRKHGKTYESARKEPPQPASQPQPVEMGTSSPRPRLSRENSQDLNDLFSQLLSKLTTNVAKRNIVMLGDPCCGRTSLARSWSSLITPEVAIHKLATVRVHRVLVRDVPLDLCIYDIPSLNLDQQWKRSLPADIDCILLCFDIGSTLSLENVEERWNQRAKESSKKVPRILVGCKSDTKDNTISASDASKEGGEVVTPNKAQKSALSIGALQYFATSTKKNEGLNELFEFTAHTVFGAADRKSARKDKKMSRRLFFGKDTKDRT